MEQTEKILPDQDADQKTEDTQEKPADMSLVEAALYVAGRPLDINELCSVLKTRSKNRARRTDSCARQSLSARTRPNPNCSIL